MSMSVGNHERRHFRSNGVSSCRVPSERRFSDDELLLLDDRWQQQRRHKLLGFHVTRVDCPTLGFSPFFFSSFLRKLVAAVTGQYKKKKKIEECAGACCPGFIHHVMGPTLFTSFFFFPP